MEATDIEKIVLEYIRPLLHMSLASARDGMPWVCEVHFAYDVNLNLYFRSLSSQRHSLEIAQNPHVAGNIIKTHSLDDDATGVYFEGSAQLLHEGDEQNFAAECLVQRLQASKEIINEALDHNGHQFYKISVNNWYVFGSFGDRPAQKYVLEWGK